MATERTPRISANKLGEYMVATASRRRAIVKDQKRPPAIVVARYRQADEPVMEFFKKGDIDILHAAAGRLRSTAGATQWSQSDLQSTAEALEAVGRMKDVLLAPGLRFAEPQSQPKKLTFGGVQVSVQPDLLVFGEHAGRPAMGALKLHYIKNDESALTTKGAEYVATLLHQWTLQYGPGGHVAVPKLSRSVDVFRAATTQAPTSQTRRMADVHAACEEIAARWGSV